MKNISELPTRMKLIKVDIMVWNSLKSLKSENDTFNDVIKTLLGQRTKLLGNDNVSATKYSRKVSFVETAYKDIPIGIEFEYNDVKSQRDNFTLDLKFRKIFYEKRKNANPSEFFGVDSAHKHLNLDYLRLYLECVSFALNKEFRVLFFEKYVDTRTDDKSRYENLIKWKKIYYENNLSSESLSYDIEEPLRLSDEEKITLDYKKRVYSSISAKLFDYTRRVNEL